MKRTVKTDAMILIIIVSINVTMFALGMVFNKAAFIGALLPINIMICAVIGEFD
jgi:hypothetical protein